MLRLGLPLSAALGLLLQSCAREPAPEPAVASKATHARPVSAQADSAPAPAPAPVMAAAPGVNLFANPGFESGPEGWVHMGGQNWGAFDIVEAPVHAGARAARLTVKAAAGERLPASKVFGVVQELRRDAMPGGFPEMLSGWYFVEQWESADPTVFTYLQAVVIVWGDPRTGGLVGAPNIQNYQVRFMLAGSEKQPFQMSNARYHFIERASPAVGRWVRFEIPVRERFQEIWGVVPDGYEFLRVLFEARWDHRPESAKVDAVVLYDDLFFGYPRDAAAP